MYLTPRTRLLYAEDDEDTRDLICVVLEAEGFEVVCAGNPLEFLKLAKDESWHLYMLDTWMPEMNGFEVCTKIREFDSSTPIVFYSAAALERDKKRAFECGAFDYFIKPVPFEVLIKGIRAAVNSRLPAIGINAVP
jgi:DNA-binding response OmpR family regulator